MPAAGYEDTVPMQMNPLRLSNIKSTTCLRPHPKGGNCKAAPLPGESFCKNHACPVPGCDLGKSSSAKGCGIHLEGWTPNSETKIEGGNLSPPGSTQPGPPNGAAGVQPAVAESAITTTKSASEEAAPPGYLTVAGLDDSSSPEDNSLSMSIDRAPVVPDPDQYVSSCSLKFSENIYDPDQYVSSCSLKFSEEIYAECEEFVPSLTFIYLLPVPTLR